MNHINNGLPSSSSSEIQRNERIVSIRSSSNRSSNVATTTNDEIAIYTSRNMEQSTPNSYRVSPYDTIISETLLDDDRTIDAAVVEAILEDNTPPVNQQSSPAAAASSSSSNHQNDTRPNRITTNISAEAQLIPMAISNQDHIPEVQPEVDIEEVHFQQHDRHAMSTISALTTNTTSIDQRDTKQPPSSSSTPRVAAAIVNDDDDNVEQRQQSNHLLPYPPIHPPYPAVLSSSAFAVLPPPPIPQRHTLVVSNVRGYSTGTTTSTTTSPSIPMFQSTMMMMRHSSSDHTPQSSSNESRRRRSQHLVEELPDYKDQARSILPHRVPMNTRNDSGGGSDSNTPNSNTQNSSSGGASHHYNNSSSGQTSQSHLHSDDEHIPVVAAILVPAERLAAEERLEEQWIQQQQNRYTTYAEGGGMEPQRYQPSNSNLSSAESTLTTSQSSNSNSNNNNHNHNNNNLTTQSGESHVASHSQRSKENSDNIDINSMSERRFWMTIILTALVLNSMLVAGAVVGGFCAAGKCSTTGSSNNVAVPPTLEINNTTTNIPVPAAVPSLIPLLSPSPSATRFLSQNPSLVNPDATIDRVPVPTPVPVPTADNVAVVNPTLSSFLDTPYPTVTDHPTPATGAFPTPSPTISIYNFPSGEAVSNNFTIGTTETEPPVGDDAFLTDGTEAPKTVPDDGKTVEVGTLSPTISPSMINITGDNFGNESVGSITDESRKGIRFVVLIPILVGMELMIVLGLVVFYRHWKQNQRQKQLSIRDTSHHDDTAPSSPATNHTSTSSSSSSEEQMIPPESSPSTNTIDHRSDRYMDHRASGPLSTIEERSVLFEV